LLVSSVGIATAVNCYSCTYWEDNENSNADCLESNPGYKYAINCRVQDNGEGLTPYCRKIETLVEDKKVIHRDCYEPNITNYRDWDLADQCPSLRKPVDLTSSGFGIIPKGSTECFCTYDKCNGASVFGLSASLFGLTLIKLLGFF